MTPNQTAFLSMISKSEGTNRAADPYRVCYGYKHIIADLSDHPAITGEWHGESLDSLGPSYVGKVSTAAGRYQINKPTWLDVKNALSLSDFSAASQDDAALYLIKRAGALTLVNEGLLDGAIEACKGVWASLPGNSAGQPQAKLADLKQAYTDAGGAFA